MTRFLMLRFAMTLATLLAVSVLVFSVARIQGDPRVLLLADQFGGIDPVQWEAMGKDLGLDKSPVHQYFIFLGKILRGDLGRSVWHAKPVGSIIAERLPATLQLALAGLAFAVVTGVPLGVLAAVKRGTIWDQMARGFALIGQAAPSFWIGILLIFIFGVSINLLPTSRKGRHHSLHHAGDRRGLVRRGGAGPADPLGDDRGPRLRVREVREGQGGDADMDHMETRTS